MTIPARFKKHPFTLSFLILTSLATGSLVGFTFALYNDLPKVRKLDIYRPNVVTKIFSEDGQQIAELFREKRIWTPYRSIPKNLVDALLAVEDTEFFNHEGIRFMSIARALVVDIRMGRAAQGGSTITQQLAKQLFLSPDKTIIRKIKEALLAVQLEKGYTKEKILELYCNQIYLGSGAYGFEAAAKTYFGKVLGDLTLEESALLAGLPKAPNRYSPLTNLNLSIQRRDTVLSRMRETGIIDRDRELSARAKPVKLVAKEQKKIFAGHFVEEIRQYLETTYGTERVYREGFQVTTTLDVGFQKIAEKALEKGVKKVTDRVAKTHRYQKNPSIEGAIVVIRPEDGAILAMVGGKDFTSSKFNRATQAKRQPGSAFKPFIFLAAIDTGITAADTIIDSPASYPGAKGKRWTPENFSHRFYGPVTLRKTLESSLNVATVKLLDTVGIAAAISMAQKSGISSALPPYLSLGLGSGEVTPLELTSAYATIANRGVHARPYYIVSISTVDGEVLEDNSPEYSDAFRPEVAYVMTKMLQGVVENGTGRIARKLQRPVAAKTGTTSDNRDAWFVGFTTDLAVGVWVGDDDNRSLGKFETGGRTSGPIWTEFMAKALARTPITDFNRPKNVVEKTIGRQSGLLATGACPDHIKEVFISGTEPVKYCKKEEVDDGRI